MTHPEKPSSTADTVATTLLWIALAVVGGVGGFFSLFAVMATDRCSSGPDDHATTPPSTPRSPLRGRTGAGRGGRARRHRLGGEQATTKFFWPLIGLVPVVLALGGERYCSTPVSGWISR